MNTPSSVAKPRVVIVGAGFGGMAAAKAIDPSRADVVLIDRANHHLFQPLLYQVATAALSPSDIATANRTLLRGDQARIVMTEVVGLDVAASAVLLADGTREPFDHLVLAIGSAYSFFGHDTWQRHALVLKSLEDALAIRTRLLDHFEAATRSTDQATISRLPHLCGRRRRPDRRRTRGHDCRISSGRCCRAISLRWGRTPRGSSWPRAASGCLRASRRRSRPMPSGR